MAAEIRPAKAAWKHRLSSVGIEALPVVVVIAGTLVALASIAASGWARILLYNADSLALPILEKSVLEGQPIHFVFSSQLFLFPEALLYLLSSALSGSVRGALMVNAVLNVVAMYGVFRVIAYLLAHRSRHRFVEISISLFTTLLFVVFVLLEPEATVNLSGLATPLLATTYYYGVILSTLGVIALTLWLTRSFSKPSWGRKRVVIYAASIFVIVGLTTFSNPLFIFQAFAPFTVGLVILVFCARISWSRFAVLVGANAVAILVAMIARRAFSFLFPIAISGYVSIDHIPDSIRQLKNALSEMLVSGPGTFKLLIVGFLLVVTFGLFVFALYAQSRPRLARRIANDEVFIVSFVSVSTISLVVGMVLTGSTTTRYLEPLMVFPLLTCIAVGVYVLRRLLIEVSNSDLRKNLSRFVLGVAAAMASLVLVAGMISIPPVVRMISGAGYTDASCLNTFVGKSSINGVSTFWTARPLELYGTHKGDILQVGTNLTPFQWMVNLGAYENKEFSYVVLDGTPFLPTTSLTPLGKPAKVIKCATYDIYDYQGTAGESILTHTIQQSVNSALKSRG